MTHTTGSGTVYFDNAATTWPKPLVVREAVQKALTTYGANPGRSGYLLGMESSQAVYRCREAAADFFGLANSSQVVFVQNCTMALNIVLKGLLKQGGRVIVSNLEHNAVMRPLNALSLNRPIYDVAAVIPGDTQATVENFRRCIRPETRAIACLHASNVFGTRLPIREIGALAHQHGLFFVVDAAQSAGVFPIHMDNDHIDYLCVPGHKGLYGPMGIGMLLCNNDWLLPSLIEGGTGSQSVDLNQPDELPDRFESGTPNTAGICGLHAGIRFVKKRGIDEISRQETENMAKLYHKFAQTKGVKLYTDCPDLSYMAPVLAINLQNHTSDSTANLLSKQGIAVRSGLHCAPCAHRSFGTLETGAVRFASSVFTTKQDVDQAYKAVRHILYMDGK